MLRRYFLLFLLGAGLFINPAAALPAPVTPADPDFNKQDYLKQISANYAWALGTGNAYEVKIAVLDTGVLTNHPDLLVDTARGWDYVDNDSTPNPDPDKSAIYYHGTAVAGIAAAEGNNNEGVTGVAWNARIIPIKVLDNDTLNSTDKIIQGINHAVNNGADIINMSLGIPVLEDIMNDPAVKADLIAQIKQKIPALSLLDDDFIANLAAALISSNVDTAALKEACDNAYNNGILLVAAMGNTTVSGTIPNYGYITLDIPQTVTSYPAGFESVIGVAGVNPDNTIGDGSLYGSGDKTTELAAPYSNMYTTHITKAGNGILIPNYNYVGQGTSYATPVVSGLAALLKGTYPDLTNKEIRKILQITATDMGDPGKDDKYGYGVVNAYNALNILNTAAPPTLVSSIPEDGDSSVTINTPITITVTDDIRVAATASIEVSTDNINIIQSELNYSGGNFTFYPPGDFYYYNDTVFVTFNFANIFGKTAEVTFSFTVAQDNTPPWIGDFTASSATDNVDLQFRVTDNETGVSWSSLEVLINDVLIDETNIGYIDTSTDEGWVSVNFVDSFYYGEFVCVTINISDISGNASSVTWAYQTASPPAPDAPVLDWRDQGLNTTDNQRLIISRPATIDAVEYWNVYYEVNGSAYITENIPVVTESITLEGVSDNQIVTAAILWIAASTNVTSNWSVTTTLNIEDRTPPLATSPLINSANVPSIMSIDILAADEDSGVNPDPASINIEVYSAKHGNIPITISYNSIHPVPYERLFFFNPVEPFMRDNPFYHEGQLVSVNFDYGDTIFVTASIADLAGNTVTLSYSYTTEEDNTPPSLSLNDVSATTVNMQLEFAASDTQTGVSWSALEIIINDSLIDPLNLNIEYINTTNYQGLVSLNFDYNFIQGQIYNVTLNLKDVSGNIGSCAITHIMDIPRPDKPTLEWTDMGLNSMDNQKVIITRPPTLDAVEYWSVYYEINGYAYITENIPAVTESITLEDVLDNQTVTAAILWVAAGTGVQSSWSDAATLNIADRTPPVMLDFSPRSDAPTNSSIAITVTDDSVISADACIEVSTDNVTTINGSLNYANNVFFFEPAQNFYYGDMVYVTLNFADVLGNTTTASFSLDVHRDTTTPYITDIVTASSVSADIVFSIVDDESGVSWNTLKIYNYSNGSSNGSGLIDSTRITVDPASGRVTIDPINNFNYGEGVYLQIRISDIFNNNTTFVIDYDIENPPAPDAPQLIWLDHGLNSGDTQEVIVSPSALLPGVDQWEIRLYANNTEFNRSQLPLPGEGVTLSGIQDEQVVSASIRWIYSGHNAASNWSEEATLNIGDRTAPVVHLRSPLNSLQDPPAAIYIGVTDNSVLSTNIALAVTLNDSPAAGW
ncbi:MAG: S8 family serine peptidase, partial [Candidatus Margulisbacteria bacterium]|nr:S8 family serine peptidase [Candidatus Margulisiibacteriota bacterium]